MLGAFDFFINGLIFMLLLWPIVKYFATVYDHPVFTTTAKINCFTAGKRRLQVRCFKDVLCSLHALGSLSVWQKLPAVHPQRRLVTIGLTNVI